jgi:hypothetical protein
MTELEKSIMEMEQKALIESKLYQKQKNNDIWFGIASKYIQITEIKSSCFVKQNFLCKHRIHNNHEFYDFKWYGLDICLKTDQMDICVKCGAVNVYYGKNKHLGFIDPNKPFPFIDSLTKTGE